MIRWSSPYLDSSHATFALVDARVARRDGTYVVSLNGNDVGAATSLAAGQREAEVQVVRMLGETLAALSPEQRKEVCA